MSSSPVVRPTSPPRATEREARRRAFDAVLLAAAQTARNKVCGLSLLERGRRVATRSGAVRVLAVEDLGSAARLCDWVKPGRDLLILNVSEQVVHTPLVEAVLGADPSSPKVAVDPEDGSYAGALWVPAGQIEALVPLLAADPREADRRLAEAWLQRGGAIAAAHGPIARHPARTRAERSGATRMLFRLVDKAQDGPISRHINRRISYPITRLLLPTPVTPNMISTLVLAVGVSGCALVAQGGDDNALLGALLVLLAGYLDGCDGEVARLRLESSRFGAWLDTIVDETTTILFLSAIGYNFYLEYGHPLIGWSTLVGIAGAVVSVYIIYYYLVIVAGSCNSQDYPTSGEGLLARLKLVVRRDLINLAAVVLLAFGLAEVVFVGMAAGAIVTAAVLVPEHLALRRALASGALLPRRHRG